MSKATLEKEIAALAGAGVEQHVSAAAIASRLGVSAKHIREEMTRGKLGYARIGRVRRVPLSLAEAYVAAHAIGDHPARIEPDAPTPIFGRRARTATH